LHAQIVQWLNGTGKRPCFQDLDPTCSLADW
jgi:hypothetical protein